MEERKKKERGIYLRKDGHWEARYSIGRAAQGRPNMKVSTVGQKRKLRKS